MNPPIPTTPLDAGPATELAVIDIGTTSIRMVIAQPLESGEFRILENLYQDVLLGRDTFSDQSIRKRTIEECVQTLKSFRTLLNQYQITDPSRIRAVATSAVREASNRVSFLDRIYMATGLTVEIADEADVSRLLYYSIAPEMGNGSPLAKGDTLAIEISGGSTEVLHLSKGSVQFSQTFRLGSYRIFSLLDVQSTPVDSRRTLMESHINRYLEQMSSGVECESTPAMLMIGGEARFFAEHCKEQKKTKGTSLAKSSIRQLKILVDDILKHTPDELVDLYHITFTQAETLGSSLLGYYLIAKHFGVKDIYITERSMRDGLLTEMRQGNTIDHDIQAHVIQAALDVGKKYHFHKGHATCVASLCQQLFDALIDEHHLDERSRFLLSIATLLHEIGYFISSQSHHKHSKYLIENSEIFGLGSRDLNLVALIARYHRRAAPKASHEGYNVLSRADRTIVTKLSALLRVADALDYSHSQRIKTIHCKLEKDRFVIEVPNKDDLTLERIALNDKGSLFEEVYGLKPFLRNKRK